MRGTILKKIRKKLLAALTDKTEKQRPMTLLEKEFLRDCGLVIDNGAKKQIELFRLQYIADGLVYDEPF